MYKEKNIDYRDGDVTLQGYLAADANTSVKKPAVLVVHDWSGKNEFACAKARQLADLGYIGFAIDMYGNGKTGRTKEEKSALMQPLVTDRTKLQKRILAAFDCAKQLDHVDTNCIGVIGFCFGGLCALDLARSGADLRAAISFHGLLHAPDRIAKHPIKAKILVLHGYDDPMVTPDQIVAFGDEMTRAKADWELNIYGNAMHAFTNPDANDPSFGTVYNEQANSRAWIAMKAFFKEAFASNVTN